MNPLTGDPETTEIFLYVSYKLKIRVTTGRIKRDEVM
jgi:hypothetical protein